MRDGIIFLFRKKKEPEGKEKEWLIFFNLF